MEALYKDIQPTKNMAKRATRFVVLIGLVSLFSDMTYESARSINGQFLEKFGVHGHTVGWVAGIGELLGYGLRIISGYFSDKTKKYWTITIAGYLINLISVPLLAWAGFWQIAVLLMILERVGKAIRTPARDAMLSYGVQQIGRGWGFGLQEFLDQTGATIGPLLVSAVLLYKNGNYHTAYLYLFIPAIIAVIILLTACAIFPDPKSLEIKTTSIAATGYHWKYWYFLSAAALIAMGYADFPLIAYHFKKTGIINDPVIPIIYSVAMVTAGLSSLIFGKLLDKRGVIVMIVTAIAALFFAPLVFLGNIAMAWVGMILWGMGMGVQDALLKAVITDFIPSDKRGVGFGMYNTTFGIAWFVGSVIMGYLYDWNTVAIVLFSMLTQMVSVIWFIVIFFDEGFNKRKEAKAR